MTLSQSQAYLNGFPLSTIGQSEDLSERNERIRRTKSGFFRRNRLHPADLMKRDLALEAPALDGGNHEETAQQAAGRFVRSVSGPQSLLEKISP